MVFPRKFTFGSGTFSKRNSRISTLASIAMSGFRGLPVPSFFIASGTGDVPDGYEPPGASTLDRGEVQTQLLRPASGGLRGPGLLSPVSPGGLLGLTCGLPGGVLCLSRHLLRLVGHLTGGVLRLLSSLARCVLGPLHGPARCRLGLARHLSGLVRGLARGALHALGYLAHLIRDPAERTTLLLVAA